MERQQLLKTSDRGVIFSGVPQDTMKTNGSSKAGAGRQSAKSDCQETRKLNRYESRSGFLTVFSDFFGKKSRNSFICDVVVTCFVVLNCILLINYSCGLVVGASPVISEKQLSTFHLIPSARNIRHLPCISRRTKEEGICMFAIDCLKANGTHLGTCIDRFYFGSCCQIPDFIDTIGDNNIEDNTIFGKPVQRPIEPVKDEEVLIPITSTTFTQKPTTVPKLPSTQGSTHYITKKPTPTLHTSTNFNHSTNTTTKKTPTKPSVTTTKIEEKIEPQIIPISKPNRHNATLQATTGTTTYKPFYIPSRPTRRPNVTTSTSTIQTTIFINNQLYNASKPSYVNNQKITNRPEITTEVPLKISTFQSVQDTQYITKTTTQKPTSFYTAATKKPSPKPESQLPFGTRLPSTKPPLQKPTTIFNKPTTTNVQFNTTIKPISTASVANNVPQKPIKPTIPQKVKPERPTQKPIENTTKTFSVSRPAVQRPINSTLSNRKTTTTKPTTVIIKKPTTVYKPVTTTQSTTQKTTNVYKPFTTIAKPSQKPSHPSSLSPSSTATQKPTKTPITTEKTTQASTSTPIRISTTTAKHNATLQTTKRPIVNATKIEATAKPAKPLTTSTIKQNATTASFKPTQKPTNFTTVYKPVVSYKPSPTTKKPSVKPAAIPTKPISQKPLQTSTVSSLTNEIDGPLVNKPTAEVQKPVTQATTEKIGLVTWSNYGNSAVTEAGIVNTTVKDDGWSPATPSEGWVLLPTVTSSSENVTGPTMQPSHTIPPPKKPIAGATKPTIATKPAPSNFNVSTSSAKPTIQNATTPKYPSSTNKRPHTTPKPLATKPVFTVQITTKPEEVIESENTTTTPLDEEFSTFMYISGSPSDSSPSSANGSLASSPTTPSSILNTNISATNASTTQMPSSDNSTMQSTNVNGTSIPDDAISTDKSTVSPIEIITSTGSAIPESVNMSDYTEVCGRRLWPEARIVGGARSSFGRWPWQISLRQWRTSTYLHKCGAALLNENWAITAAHCVDSVPPSDLLLRLGEHDLASEEEPYGFQERRVQIVASHPQFDPRTFEYDLALLRFYEPVTFQPNILPVCVPTDDDGFIGKTAYVTGWGRLYEDGPLPSVLQEVSVPVIENSVCESMYRSAGYIEHIPHIFICAGWKKGGYDSCEGDSGGPMVLQRSDKRFLLAGVISWGIGCAEPNQPGVYTRISQFRHWINQILQF